MLSLIWNKGFRETGKPFRRNRLMDASGFSTCRAFAQIRIRGIFNRRSLRGPILAS
jgi:hypothetical protein